ncbi:anticodon-binding protein [Dolichospermum sp. FACHB-1091]|uniref:DALR anticodon-binding domain-containing protein n=1 Tax=Dolichospermum sp. FACHB-1091 TaxID=2692798 RepID=UPI001681AE9C|nr:anticodon-binding protein [Dolichospermum sp. FACHB-1091]
MYYQLLFSKSKAIKQLISGYLASCFSVFTNDRGITGIESRKVPLYQGGYNQKILYISGMAMGISKSQNLPVMEIAQAMAGHLSQNSDSLFSVKVIPPGWIYIELIDSTLAAWLQNLIVFPENGYLVNNFLDYQLPVTNDQSQISLHSLTIFKIQYAHSRCCSLLRLGQKDGLIELDKTGTKSYFSVKPIPLLNGDQKLLLNHADEMLLMHQLVKLVDDLVCPDSSSSINWEKAAENLSQAFEKFWGSCRIWGEVKIKTPELSQARLGLLIATQLILRSVLENKLRLVALVEL